MAQQTVNIGTVAGDRTGDPLRDAFDKINDNFDELYALPHLNDHGALSGLGDDDHSQYHNDTRGDARYYTQTQLNTHLTSTANPHTVTAAQVAAVALSGDTMTGALIIDTDLTVSNQAAIGSTSSLGGSSDSILAVSDDIAILPGTETSAMELIFTATGGAAVSKPTALYAKAKIQTTNLGGAVKGVHAIAAQESNQQWAAPSYGIPQSAAIFAELMSTAGSGTGSLRNAAGICINYPSLLGGGGATSIYGLFVGDQGEANVTNAYGIFVQPPVYGSPTNSYGIVLGGDDKGADIAFGAGQDVRQHFNGTYLEFEGAGISHTASTVTHDGYITIAINGVAYKLMTGS